MEENVQKLKDFLKNLKKSPGRTYTQKTIESKLGYIANIREDFQAIYIEQKDSEEGVALKLEFNNIYENIRKYLLKSSKDTETDKMANLDMNELSIVSKLIPRFSGKTNELFEFITNIETIITTIPEEKHASFLNFILKSKLELKVQNRIKQTSVPASVEDLIKILKDTYKPFKSPNILLNEIIKTRQKDNNVMGFATKIENLIAELNEIQISEEGEENRNIIINTNSKIAFNTFINGLTEPQIIATIDASQVTTFTEAVKIAEKISSRTKQNQIFYQNAQQHKPKQNNTSFKRIICKKCGKSHGNRCPANGIKCHNCGKFNHYSKMCMTRQQQNNTNRINTNIRATNNYNNTNQRNSNQTNNSYRRWNNRNHNINHIEEQGNSTAPEFTIMETPMGTN